MEQSFKIPKKISQATENIEESPNISELPKDLRDLPPKKVANIKTKDIPGDPFASFRIADSHILDTLDGRSSCPVCKKSRKYFCYNCYVPVVELEGHLPCVKLPCKIDIIKHPREIDGKSTAIHAAILASDDVRIFTYPDIPIYSKEENIVLLFPGENSLLPSDWTSGLLENNSKFPQENSTNLPEIPKLRAIFIDSTWNQTKRIKNDERLKDLQYIEIKNRETLFWRYQVGKPSTFLATIEAIYYFVVDLHEALYCESGTHQYDNLLYFFKYMYGKIHSLYGTDNLLAYKEL